jgi:uncharacterized membrane protein (UPF0127 family)
MNGIRPRRGFAAVFTTAALALAIAAGALGPACKTDGSPPAGAPAPARAAAPSVEIDTGARKVVFGVELALTPEQQERGLMYRQQLAPDAGMLFVSPRPRPQVFWMKNTLIPLDMIFIGADRRIVGIVENAEPETLTARRVEGDSQYVLEIGGGLSAKLGIRAGQPVEMRAVPVPPSSSP